MTIKTIFVLDAAGVRERCSTLGLSLNALAKQASMDRSALSRLLNGARQPRPDTLDRLAVPLQCSGSDLLKSHQVDVPDTATARTRVSGNSITQSRHHASLRALAFMRYGLECACCGEAEYQFLTIDHVVPGVPDSGPRHHLYSWLHRNGHPAGFQTLCFNCNSGKASRPECPHKARGPRFVSDSARGLWGLKVDTLKAYGGVCQCCSEADPHFLTIDHVEGGGKAHRASLGSSSGSTFYRALKKNGYPNDPPLRVLCFNCNHAVHYGACPHKV